MLRRSCFLKFSPEAHHQVATCVASSCSSSSSSSSAIHQFVSQTLRASTNNNNNNDPLTSPTPPDLEQQRLQKKNIDIVRTAFLRLLAQPYYGQCPLRRYAIKQAIKSIDSTDPSKNIPSENNIHQAKDGDSFSASSSSSSSTSATTSLTRVRHQLDPTSPLTVADLVLDSYRDSLDRKYPHLGPGLRRVALEALDPNLRSYTCTTPGGGAIPFDDIQSHVRKIEEIAKFLNPNWIVAAVGSHRRGAPASRSIDVLITDPATRSSGPSFSHSLQQEAPFVVLSKMKRAMEASGYAIYSQQQNGKGFATLAALVQHEPFSEKDEFFDEEVADKSKYFSRRLVNPNNNNHNNGNQQNGNSSSSSSIRNNSCSNLVGNILAASPDLQRPPINSSTPCQRLSQQKISSQGINNNKATYDISTGQIPEEFVTPRAESLMNKLLKLHQRQQDRVDKEIKQQQQQPVKEEDEIEKRLLENQEHQIVNDKEENDESDAEASFSSSPSPFSLEELDGCMKMALEACPPAPRQFMSAFPKSSNAMLKDITSSSGEQILIDEDEVDQDRQQQQQQQHNNNINVRSSHSAQSRKSTATDEDDDCVLGVDDFQLHPEVGEAETESSSSSADSSNDNKNTDQTTSDSTGLENNLNKFKDLKEKKKKDARSHNMVFQSGIAIAKKFPLDPRKIPRRVNIVWAPYDRFYALKLLLTGPKEFSNYLIDRAPRFGYKLSHDGVFEKNGTNNNFNHQQNLQNNNNNNTSDESDSSATAESTLRQQIRDEEQSDVTSTKTIAKKSEKHVITPHNRHEVVINSESELLAKLKLGYLSPLDR